MLTTDCVPITDPVAFSILKTVEVDAFCELWKEDPQFRARCHLAHLSLFLSVVVLVLAVLALHCLNK